MVSAYSSGRKGTVEAERRGGVEHRARDKQVGVTGWGWRFGLRGPRDASARIGPRRWDPDLEGAG